MSVETMLAKIEESIKLLEASVAEKNAQRENNIKLRDSAQEQVDKHKKNIDDIDVELLDIECQIENHKEKIALVRAYDLEKKEAFRTIQIAFNTLYAKSEAGSITSSDLEEFRKVAGYEIPIAETDEGDESETEELEATGT